LIVKVNTFLFALEQLAMQNDTRTNNITSNVPMQQDPEFRQIMEELKNLSPTQIEQKITQMIGMGQTLQLAEEQELVECEQLGILDLINEKTN
jgi:hypothetical protein